MNVTFALGDRSYDVVVRDGARHDLTALIARKAPKAQLAVVLAPASLQTLPWFRDLETGLNTEVVTIPEGEAAKTPATVASLCETLAVRGVSRHDVVVGVGGGATTDLAGFVAAVYLRGVAVVHVATTLVAQVDAALGGKTGVNLAAGKNLMGAFHQPLGVLCDGAVLATLPEREYRAGLGEVAKCWLLEGRDASTLGERDDDAITLAIAVKARVVSADEREGGVRALLNYGHTLAHAIEALQFEGGNDVVLHGEAVAIGIAFAIRLAARLGRVSETAVSSTDAVLAHFRLRTSLPKGLSADELLAAMARDKKAHHDLTFVLPSAEGFSSVAGVDPLVVRDELLRFGAL